ncbi:hypothetical protein USB125703_01194 [Pseudoclavibacter triregionum]|nr:hypothetical protein USB125703_01194 [Pseudoclavibacter triregionum]
MSNATVAAADTDGNETTTLEASTSTAAIADPSGTALTLTLVDESGHPAPSEVTADQHMYTQHSEGVSSTTLLHDDGSVQTVSVISEPASATRTQYAVEAEGLAAISSVEGALLIRAEDGSLIGGLAPAWAVDANGQAVPTHYEVEGNLITQVVDHASSTYAYPIVADPFWGTNLFDKVELGPGVHILTPSGWGRAIQNGVVNGPVTGRIIFMNEGWREFLHRSPGPQWIFPTVRQQYACHVWYAGADWIGGPTWDLEIDRPVVTPDLVTYNVARHQCNWNYPDGSV